MAIWQTWLGFLGLVAGVVAAAVFGWPPLRSALIGFAGGVTAVILVNVAAPTPAPCLKEAKHADILRAYSLRCRSEADLQQLRGSGQPKK